MWIKLNITKAKKKKRKEKEIYRSQEKSTNKNTKKLRRSEKLSSVKINLINLL